MNCKHLPLEPASPPWNRVAAWECSVDVWRVVSKHLVNERGRYRLLAEWPYWTLINLAKSFSL